MGRKQGWEKKRNETQRDRGRKRLPSRDAGGFVGGSALAGRACVNKRPSAVMAVSATSDAFRWLFSPGCLGVAWNLLPRNPSPLLESRLLYSPVRSNTVATTQPPSFVAGVTGRTRVIRQPGTISPVLLINLYKFSRDIILHTGLPAFTTRTSSLTATDEAFYLGFAKLRKWRRDWQLIFFITIKSEWWSYLDIYDITILLNLKLVKKIIRQ